MGRGAEFGPTHDAPLQGSRLTVWRPLEVGTVLLTAIPPQSAVDAVSGFEGTIGVVASLETWNGFQPQLEHGEAERDCT